MSIKFEEGKNYVNRNGDVMECVGIYDSTVELVYPDTMNNYNVYKDGRFHLSVIHGLDIIAEYEPKEKLKTSNFESKFFKSGGYASDLDDDGKSKPKLKTVKDILNDLPDPYRRWAFANIEEQKPEGTLLLIGVDLKSAVGLFNWHRAKYPKHIKDGRDMISFWNKVAEGDSPPITKKQEQKTNDKYNRTIKDRTGKELGIVDVYCVGDAFGVDSKPLNHALKKILCAGTRGKGDEVQDLEEAIQAIQRRLMEVKK